ncbi:hypothetical protein N9R04_01730 [Staphylococcus sp. SQ8-PEA]|uniref:Lipoprotein n=1 Tax=Staphylococcus marylandisciuri TaxID=2981529 RepID=A0ABT2QN80_9STAP|nr:hypothetical protein [Staphylococcus marylandisciuri]MCU5745441.1 hypothetical protein [Staphylococcus marylandisciuri]
MKKLLYITGVILFLAVCYLFVNFLFFDSWACYSSEKEINSYISKHDTNKLKDISANNKTYEYLKHSKHITIKMMGDNQGSGHIGYYPIELNHKEASLYVNIKYDFLPEKPKVKNIKLEQ